MGSAAGGSDEELDETETSELLARLARYPSSRYPVQHATAAFRLATLHLSRGRPQQAASLLDTSHAIFTRLGMRLEQAKTLTMQGVAQRSAGRSDLAAQTFEHATRSFLELEQPTEEAAASYNLGLALLDQDDPEAETSFARAQDLFLATGRLRQAAAAARERGALLLTAGEVRQALTTLGQAAALAERAGDLPGLGAAANALGLAHLADDDPAGAAREFMRAVGAFPRSLRGAEHAMAKANLAVAHERCGNQARARLAARQALAIGAIDAPVRAQAEALVARLNTPASSDLLAVLDDEPVDRWSATVREEVLRWCTSPPEVHLAGLRAFLTGLLARPGRSRDLGGCLVEVLVELPPSQYDAMVEQIVRVTADLATEDADLLRSVLGSAMARLALPQWQRLATHLNAAAVVADEPADWR